MIELDTNVILRYLLQDNPEQTPLANRIFERRVSQSNPGYINLATVLEIVWVLRSRFKLTPSQIATHVEKILVADSLRVQNEQQIFEAAFALKSGIGEFEDALMGALNSWSGCSFALTFDQRATRLPSFKKIA